MRLIGLCGTSQLNDDIGAWLAKTQGFNVAKTTDDIRGDFVCTNVVAQADADKIHKNGGTLLQVCVGPGWVMNTGIEQSLGDQTVFDFAALITALKPCISHWSFHMAHHFSDLYPMSTDTRDSSCFLCSLWFDSISPNRYHLTYDYWFDTAYEIISRDQILSSPGQFFSRNIIGIKQKEREFCFTVGNAWEEVLSYRHSAVILHNKAAVREKIAKIQVSFLRFKVAGDVLKLLLSFLVKETNVSVKPSDIMTSDQNDENEGDNEGDSEEEDDYYLPFLPSNKRQRVVT